MIVDSKQLGLTSLIVHLKRLPELKIIRMKSRIVDDAIVDFEYKGYPLKIIEDSADDLLLIQASTDRENPEICDILEYHIANFKTVWPYEWLLKGCC